MSEAERAISTVNRRIASCRFGRAWRGDDGRWRGGDEAGIAAGDLGGGARRNGPDSAPKPGAANIAVIKVASPPRLFCSPGGGLPEMPRGDGFGGEITRI
jgi:hypothetical protein